MATSVSYLTVDDLKLIEDEGEVGTYRPRDVIVHQQAECDRLYFIRSGMVQIDFSRLYGADVLAYLNEGDMFGEVSFMDHRETSATASAVDAVETLEIPREALHRLVETDPEFAARFYRTIAATLAARIRSQNRK